MRVCVHEVFEGGVERQGVHTLPLTPPPCEVTPVQAYIIEEASGAPPTSPPSTPPGHTCHTCAGP